MKIYNFKVPYWALITMLLTTLSIPTMVNGEENTPTIRTQVPFILQSVKLKHFEKAFHLPGPKGKIVYQESMVLKCKVDKAQYYALPPSQSLVLSIGNKHYSIIREEMNGQSKQLTLVFHIRDYETLTENDEISLHLPGGMPFRAVPGELTETRAAYLRSSVADER